MPILESDLSYEDMKKAKDRFVCAECGSSLNIVWGGFYGHNCYVLKCTENFNHNGLKPLGRDPELLEIAHKIHGKELPMETKALKKLDENQMLSRIEKARFPSDLSKQDRQLMATIAIEYGLDPLFGELMIYQGKPYVTIDARRRKAQETKQLAGVNSRPANKEEREERGMKEGDYLFVCQVWVKDTEHPFEGWGRVRAAEVKGSEHLPIVKNPAAMAEKRAEAQALRRAFHIPLPSAEDIIEAEFTVLSEEKEPPGAEKKQTKPLTKPLAPGKALPAKPVIPPSANRLTDAQKGKIEKECEAKGISEGTLYNYIKQQFGAESVDELSVAQASKLIDAILAGALQGTMDLGD